MFVEYESKFQTNKEMAATTTTTSSTLKCSIDELERRQTDIHRHLSQLSSVMSDFEYYMARIRHMSKSTTTENSNLCQALLSHLETLINDTRSTLAASTTNTNDTQHIHDLVNRLYQENQQIANHIDNLLKQDSADIDLKYEHSEEDHIRKAIEHMELALEQNQREQYSFDKGREYYETSQRTLQTFMHSTDKLHEEALNTLKEHVKTLRENNQSLKQFNEKIDLLTRQLPRSLFLSAQ